MSLIPIRERYLSLELGVNIKAVSKAFGLGPPIAEPSRVYGGLLHHMWKLQTETGAYAIKALSSDIPVKDEKINSNYELTEQIAARFIERGVSAVSALKSKGKHLLEVNGRYFLVYPWVNAMALNANVISEYHALKIAEVLAHIHQIHLEGARPQEMPGELYTTERLLNIIKKAEEFHCPFARDLRAHEQALIGIKDAYIRSVAPLQQNQIITHGDLDQKNVLWDEHRQPILIDWEAAAFTNPTYDLINVALNWSGITTEQFDQNLFLKMIETYKKAGGVVDHSLLPAAFDGACGWIHWMIYNVERACTMGASEQKTLGIAQVNQTLAAMLRLQRLRSGLILALGC